MEGRSILLPVLCAIGDDECAAVEAISERSGRGRRQVAKAAGSLIGRGLIERAEVGCYRLTNAGREAKRKRLPLTSGPNGPLTQAHPRRPRRRTLRDRLWAAMRLKGKFTIGDLLDVARSDGEDGYDSARRYLRALEKSGVVSRLRGRVPGTAITSNGFVRFALIRDLGPAAPIVRASGKVWDSNAGKIVECEAPL